MNKKIIIISILAVLMLMAISFVTAVGTKKTEEKKESPLFGIRTQRAVNVNIPISKEKIFNIVANFLKNRIFIVPTFLKKYDNQETVNRLSTWQKDMCDWTAADDANTICKTNCQCKLNNDNNLNFNLNTRGGVCTYNKWCWDLS